MIKKIEMTETGSGPAVLLLHGVPGLAEDFAPLVDALAPSHRVLVATLPGYGQAPPLPDPYSMARVTSLLEDTLLARGVESVALVGHSVGAYRAFALALSARVPVTRIVALGGLAGLDPAVREQYSTFAKMLRNGDDFREFAITHFLAPAYAAAHPEDAAHVGDLMNAAPSAVLAAEVDAMTTMEDLRPRLSSLLVPILVRSGALDLGIPLAWSEEIARRAPHATMQIVPGCGHMLLLEDRAATVAAVKAALG